MTALLRCENICFSYGNDTRVLQDCTAEFSSNEIHYIVGPSGCGKTTLALILAGVLTPDSGTVVHSRDGFATLVPQFPEHMFLSDSVPAELDTLPNESARQEAQRIIEEFGLGEAVGSGKSPLRFSFGQRRVLAIALQASLSDYVVILDEPTLGLDAVYLEKFRRWARKRTQQRTILIAISHDYDLIRAMPGNVLILNHGSVFWQGDSMMFLKSVDLLRIAAAI